MNSIQKFDKLRDIDSKINSLEKDLEKCSTSKDGKDLNLLKINFEEAYKKSIQIRQLIIEKQRLIGIPTPLFPTSEQPRTILGIDIPLPSDI